MVEIFVPVAAGLTVVGTVLCATFMCCGRCRCCKHWKEQREREALVSSCSKVRYSKRANSCPNEKPPVPPTETLANEYKTCAICLDDFKEREYVTVCPCGHGYHRDCLIGWLQTTPSCPVCKSSVAAQNSDAERTPLLP